MRLCNRFHRRSRNDFFTKFGQLESLTKPIAFRLRINLRKFYEVFIRYALRKKLFNTYILLFFLLIKKRFVLVNIALWVLENHAGIVSCLNPIFEIKN